MPWQVRPACAGDQQALLSLWQEVDELHASIVPSYFRSPHLQFDAVVARRTAAFRRVLVGGDETMLVAERKGRDNEKESAPLGLVHLQLYETPREPLMVSTRRAYVDDLVVATQSRRTGCGRALMGAATAWARGRGAKELVLTVWTGNVEAERFYSALGYKSISQVLGIDL